jgi:hypothetical protein
MKIRVFPWSVAIFAPTVLPVEMPFMAVDHYLLYLLCSCAKYGIAKEYVGITGVLRGQSDEEAKRFRKRWHVAKPKLWLKGKDLAGGQMETLRTKLTLKNALIEEARETARLYMTLESGDKVVRGGPWCRCRLPPCDTEEIAAVAACSSRKQVSDLAASWPEGSLACHLAGRSYSRVPQEVSLATSSSTLCSAKTPPLVLIPPKRRSGASGHDYRVGAGVSYGSPRYEALKYGEEDPKKVRNKAQAKYRA